MSIRLPANHLLREILGAIAGMSIALLLYLGFRQYSFMTLRGSLVDVSATSSSAASADATASIEAESAERIAERERLIAERLAALAVRHSSSLSSGSESASSPSSVSPDAPTVPGNVTTIVSDRERLALRAERIAATDNADESDISASADITETAPRELAGVPADPVETVIDMPPAIMDPPTVIVDVHQPLPESGPGEYGMAIVAFLITAILIARRRNTIQAAQ